MATNKRLIKSNDEGGGVVPLSFNTVTYTGNSSTQSITGVGFQPDLVWIKRRNTTEDHALFDSVRGALKMISSNLTAAEYTTAAPYEAVSSFDSDGFTTGDNGATNRSPNDYVAWNFKAGGAAVTNTDGTITSQVSANTEAGFSIVSWKSTGSVASVGHGLGVAPNIIIAKKRDSAGNWNVYSSEIGNNKRLFLNDTIAEQISDVWGYTDPTDSVFTQDVTASTENVIAYCFAEVAGFSKFGSYTGVSSGVTINVGFEPAFVMVKCTNNAEPWIIIDNKRGSTKALAPSSSDAEYSAAGFTFTFTSTGFSFPDQAIADATLNQNGYEYIYMAFANQF